MRGKDQWALLVPYTKGDSYRWSLHFRREIDPLSVSSGSYSRAAMDFLDPWTFPVPLHVTWPRRLLGKSHTLHDVETQFIRSVRRDRPMCIYSFGQDPRAWIFGRWTATPSFSEQKKHTRQLPTNSS